MQKNPDFDLRSQYRRALEAALALALTLMIIVFIASKKFESGTAVKAVDVPTIQVEDIPITRTVKRIEVPRKPTIPVEDPEINPEDNIDLPDIDIFDPTIKPPPPPPSIEEEAVPFFKVERPPQLIGGEAAIQDYINKNNLYPKVAADAQISGVVMIGFIVNKEGVPTEVSALQEKPQGLGFGEAGVKVMRAMRFSPGYQRDKPVSVKMQQPIRFIIE
ncbi:MAG: TonB family protein [Calditrichaeota bacterium]|nr:TonB family protein [Calditrichota bacterium]